MRGYSYVIPRDYGFAPNPFGAYATLATCKPNIRASAQVGDWIIGCGSAQRGLQGKLVFALHVCEALSFNQYWGDSRFQAKKPIMTGTLKQMYGDNIYCQTGGRWSQLDSHHSNDDGSINLSNLQKDTSTDRVLIASEFYYFGGGAICLPNGMSEGLITSVRDFQYANIAKLNLLIVFLRSNFEVGIITDPLWFDRFERYDGVS